MILTCLHCGQNWKSKVSNPVSCPKKGCRSRIWYRESRKGYYARSEEQKLRLQLISNNMKGRKQSPEHTKKRISQLRGNNHWNWKGGITPINEQIRKSLEYNEWRIKVFERDNYTCQGCGQIGGYLEADHIKSFALFPDLRLEVDNGRTLCKSCHYKLGWNIFRDANPRKTPLPPERRLK